MPCFKLTFLIFALLLVACDDMIFDNCQSSDVSLVISPASPVEFWATDCETYNEKQICGVFPQCFCAPWECDDEIKIPGVDYDTDDLYELAILNSDGDEVDRVEFVQQELFYVQETDALENFENLEGIGTISWVIDSSPGVSVPGSSPGTTTARILAPKSQLPLDSGVLYNVDFNFTKADVDANAGTLRFVLLDEFDNIVSNTNTVLFNNGTFNVSYTFVGISGAVKFGWYITRFSLGSEPTINIIMNSYSISRIAYSHLATFIPEDSGICDEKIQLKIYNVTASPDTEEYHSDCLDVAEEQSCSLLIDYSHDQNIRGIIYTEGSPELTLSIRVPATMRVQQFPQEDFAMQLTTGIEKISSSVKGQTLFETDYSPYFFHRKLIMIFAHKNVFIGGQYWKKENEYSIQEGDRKQALKMGEVFLTEDFTFRVNS